MKKFKIRKGDNVRVIAGAQKGNEGKVIKIVSLEKALEDFPNTSIVVGSFEFLEQIEGTIAKALRERNLKNRVFSVKNLEE